MANEGGTSALKIVGIVIGVLFLIGACGIGSCLLFCGGVAAVGSAGQQQAAQQQAQQDAVTVSELPWITTVQQNCHRYESAPNEIQKSAIFNENQQFISGQTLSNARGTLQRLQTSQGGGGLTLKAAVGSATFENGGLIGISQSSPIYTSASTLTVGQCVIVSGTLTSAASIVERSKVCDLDYYIRWTSISPCPD